MNPYARQVGVALEITPPRELRPEILLRRARLIPADTVHVIQRPDRLPSLEASLLLADAGLEPVWHVVNRARSRAEIETDLRRAGNGGIRRALCVRGEGDDKDGPTTPRIWEVVARLRDAWPDGSIGVTLNQYGPRERVLENLFRKLDAGADFVQTQPVFDLGIFESLAREVKSRAPDVALVPMLMPAVPRAAAEIVTRRLGVPLPTTSGADGWGGWEGFVGTFRALARGRLADGVAILTPTMDPSADFLASLREALAPG